MGYGKQLFVSSGSAATAWRRLLQHRECPRRGAASVLIALAVLGMSAASQAATINSISYLSLAGDNTFQDPPGLLHGTSIEYLTNLTTSVSERGVQGGRDNSQSFTVDLADFPLGIDVSAFAINYESAPVSASATLGVRLFKIPSVGGNLPATNAIGVTDLLVSSDGLEFETSATNGTATFTFDAPIHLAPGAYAWRFHVAGSSTTTLFNWNRSSSPAYALGNKYEGNADTAAQTSPASDDFHFGLVAVVSVPEPSSMMLIALGFCAFCFRRR